MVHPKDMNRLRLSNYWFAKLRQEYPDMDGEKIQTLVERALSDRQILKDRVFNLEKEKMELYKQIILKTGDAPQIAQKAVLFSLVRSQTLNITKNGQEIQLLAISIVTARKYPQTEANYIKFKERMPIDI
jgi:hypothetical protein